MTAAERLARELFTAAYPSQTLDMHADLLKESWERLARHVLRRERAARGRTLGYVTHNGYEPLLTLGEAQMQANACGGVVARVVAVPKRRGAKR